MTIIDFLSRVPTDEAALEKKLGEMYAMYSVRTLLLFLNENRIKRKGQQFRFEIEKRVFQNQR